MTRRLLWIFVMTMPGLLAAQTPSRADAIPQSGTAPAKSAILESNVAYLRASHIEKNLADEIRAAQGALAVSNTIAGTILDLRFADGDDVEAAKAAADLFAAKKLPLAILVNGGTRGAAAALAAMLHEARDGLIFGSATQEIKFTGGPLQPDIVVASGPEDERVLMENPYASPAPAGTNFPSATNNLLPFVDHTSEADLVRAKIKDGDGDENLTPPRKAGPQKPFIRDPVLARAVDLIKGLAVVRASHP